eukprot:NODE_7811_length_419_cov_110.021978.p6 GENE.NODE_7811_length_419_cov_110.021978~~NODE_7811_length_419_cov_110.021978.p6  ORF type:complete len:60 (-),score=6.19 NODE_7811_length_419_cov_110.021978:11-190(-)
MPAFGIRPSRRCTSSVPPSRRLSLVGDRAEAASLRDPALGAHLLGLREVLVLGLAVAPM